MSEQFYKFNLMADRSGRIELIIVRPVVQPYLSDNFTHG